MKTINIKNYNLKIMMPDLINIIGIPGSGKTTLLKMIINLKESDILIDNKNIKEYPLEFKKKNIACIFHEFKFMKEYVKEELIYYQKEVNINTKEAYQNLDYFTKYFNLDEIIESKIEYLTQNEKALIKILSYLIFKPKLMGIDTLFSYLNKEDKLKIIKYSKKENITLLNVTYDPEDLLLFDKTIIINKYKKETFIPSKVLLEDEKKLLEISFDLPFIVNLSKGLNYYDVLNKTYYNEGKLVEDLWK